MWRKLEKAWMTCPWQKLEFLFPCLLLSLLPACLWLLLPRVFLVMVTYIVGSFNELAALAGEIGWFSARLVSWISIARYMKPTKAYGEKEKETSLPEAKLEEGSGEWDLPWGSRELLHWHSWPQNFVLSYLLEYVLSCTAIFDVNPSYLVAMQS